MRPVKGLILAAGLGSRLAPLTDQLPKPLFPVVNRPVIAYAVERFRDAGIVQIGINIHHLAEDVQAYLGNGSRFGVEITWFREKDLLGTGGILRYSAPFWQDATLVVTVGDMLSTLDLGELLEFHRSTGGIATVGSYEHSWPLEEWGGDVAVVREGSSQVVEYQPKPGAEARGRHGSTGTWVFEPEAIENLPDLDCFDLNQDFLPVLAKTGRLHAYAGDFDFDDFGQAEGYVGGTARALDGGLGALPAEPEQSPGIYVAPSARVSPSAVLEGPVVIGPETEIGPDARIYGPTVIGGGCVVGSGAVIRSSVLLPGVQVAPGMTLANGLIGDSVRTVPAIRKHHLSS